MIYQLEAMHDARKSFYGKALVESGGGTLTLYSYGAKVAETQGQGRIALYPDADYSPTTRRHVKEFAKQQAGKSISTEELRAVVDGRMRFEDAGQPSPYASRMPFSSSSSVITPAATSSSRVRARPSLS